MHLVWSITFAHFIGGAAATEGSIIGYRSIIGRRAVWGQRGKGEKAKR
jgi:hypothetical protein